MVERRYDFGRLPEEAQDDIARLEIELYDTQVELLHVYAALQILVGAACIAFGWLGDIGSFHYTGSDTIGYVGALFVILGVVNYVRKTRQVRVTMDSSDHAA